MDSPETVIEETQTEAAQAGALVVAEAAAIGDMIISDQVAHVSAEVSHVAEIVEEHHEEILEGQAWHARQWELLSTRMTALETVLQAQTVLLTALQASHSQALEILNRNSSQVSSHSIQQTPEPEAQLEVENPVGADAQREAETPAAAPPKQKKYKLV